MMLGIMINIPKPEVGLARLYVPIHQPYIVGEQW